MRIFTSILLLFIITSANAQNTLVMKVIDKENNPVTEALIIHIKKQDSKIINYTLSDSIGYFTIQNFSPLTQTLKIERIGYEPIFVLDFNVDSIIMKVNPMIIDEITVTSKPKIKIGSDRIIYDISNSLVAKDNNALEALKHTPLVHSSNDALSIIGKDVTVIYINGKPNRMGKTALNAYLNNLPASEIKNIEIITSPDVSFSGSGNFGVLNINIKKPVSDGLQGSVTAKDQQGYFNSQFIDTYLNFRKGKFGSKLSLFGNNNNTFSENSSQEVFQKSGNYTAGDYRESFNNISAGGYMEMSYDISKRQELSVMLSSEYFDKENKANSQYDYSSFDKSIIDSTSNNSTNHYSSGYRLSTNLRYTLKTGDKGSGLDVEVGYFNYNTNESSYNVWNTSTVTEFTQTTPMKVNSFVGIAKYKWVISAKSDITFGSEASLSRSRFTDQFETLGINNTTLFSFDENLFSMYAIWSQKWSDKLSTRIGVRTEYNNYHGTQNIVEEMLNDGSWEIYPSLSSAYRISNNHSISATVQNRILRPQLDELNPTMIYSSPSSIYNGNPFLKPSTYMIYQLGYSYKYKLFVNATLMDAKDIISSTTKPYDNNKTITTSLNNTEILNPSVTISYMNQFFKNRLQVNYTARAQYINREIFEENNAVIKEEIFNYGLYLDNTVMLWKRQNLRMNIYVGFNSASKSATSKSDPMWFTNISIWKRFGNFNVRITGQDIFRTMKSVNMTNQFNLTKTTSSYSDNQKIILSVSYSFGNKKIKKMNKMNNVTNTVSNRLNR